MLAKIGNGSRSARSCTGWCKEARINGKLVLRQAAQDEQADASTPDSEAPAAEPPQKVDRRRGLRPSQTGRDKANQAQQR